MTDEDELSKWLAARGVQIRRRIRILMLLDAADYAVISPVPVPRFHALAFLADVLSPIYGFPPMAGRILKFRAGPYYPDLQWEVDRLVGLSLVIPSAIRPIIESNRAYLSAELSLDRLRSAGLLDLVYKETEFAKHQDYFRELAGALGGIDDTELDAATRSDVTWNAGQNGAVINYAERLGSRNLSAMSANRMETIALASFRGAGRRLTPGTKLNLYAHYLRRVVNA